MKKILSLVFLLCCTFFSSTAFSQSVSLKTEYLMTLEAKLDLPFVATSSLLIFNVPAATVSGPNIKGTLLNPTADWGQVLPTGVFRLDVRGIIKTDDGEIIYISYNGVIKQSEKSNAKFSKGEEITPDDGVYFMTAPTFQTTSKKYDYLNGIQTIGKMIRARLSPDSAYVHYDIFSVK